MKRSYLKILFFELFVFVFLLIGVFIKPLLSFYNLPLFLGLLIVFFKFYLGYDKNNTRYIRDTVIDIILMVGIYYILYYLFGIFIGFAKNSNFYTIYAFFKILFPLILTICLKEILRYMILIKSGNNKILIVSTTLLFIFISIFSAVGFVNFKSSYDVLLFFGITFLPAISTNILNTYLSLKVGYIPNIIYLLLIDLLAYLLPIIPDPSPYVKSVISFILPIIIFIKEKDIFYKEKLVKKIDRNYNSFPILGFVLSMLFTCTLVYFVSGYFKYYAIAIVSNSMHPTFSRGTVVIVDQKPGLYKNGDIIAFKVENKIFVHRIVSIKEVDGEKYYYTKGDANSHKDNFKTLSKNIVGVVKVKIPFIGYPTVIFSEL